MKGRLRYGLRSVLALVFVFAAIAGAYRYGYVRGRADGPVIPPSLNFNHIYVREYDVSDLVAPAAGGGSRAEKLAALRKHMIAWATPGDWDVVGGYATLRPGDDGTSLVVEHSFPGHAAILEQLSRIRDERRFARNKELPQALEDAAIVLRAEAAAREHR